MKRSAVWVAVAGVFILVLSLIIGIYKATTTNPGSTAPWFGTPLFTLAGAVSGAFIAGGFGLWLEYQKREADLANADTKLQREVSVRFLSDAVRYFNAAYDTSDVSDNDLMISWTELQLVCDARQVESARDFLLAAAYFTTTRRKHNDDDSCVGDCDDDPYVDQALKWYQQCRWKYTNDLRKQYGIESLPALPYEATVPEDLHKKAESSQTPRPFISEEIAAFLEEASPESDKSKAPSDPGTAGGGQ